MSENSLPRSPETGSGAEWLVGGSEMGRVVRGMDWSKTPLGPIAQWPSSLRTTVSLALSSNFPISLAWGPEYTQIYNDGYWPICGVKHPTAMGQDFRECWASAWSGIGDAFHSARAGTTAFLEDQRMFLDRLGYLEETFFTFSFSPIRDASGDIAGLFHPVTETSSKMIGQRRTRALRDLTNGTLEARSLDEGLRLVTATIGQYELDIPFLLFYRIDPDGRTATLITQTGLPAGSPAAVSEIDLITPGPGGGPGWPLAAAVDAGSTILLADVRERFPGLACGPYPESVGSAFVQPLTPPGHRRPICVMIAGVSSRLPMDESYRSFYDLMAAAVTSVLTNVEAYHAERQRAEALAEIDRARTAFFTNVSHELRTPLTLLLGPIEDELDDLGELGGLDERNGVAPVRRERLEMAHRNSLRLLRLVNTLLDFTRMEDGRLLATFEATDLAALTTDLASNFRSVCERAGLDLVVDCPPLPEPVLVDPDMWERIVLNLLSNSFKFTVSGQITISVRAAGDIIEMAVADTGTGIPADQLAQVFERFHRVPGAHGRTHEGTGIGLAFVRELVHQHGGTIEAASRLGEGSTFTVRLPRGSAHIAPERLADGRQQPRTGGGPRGDNALPFVTEAMRWLPDADLESAVVVAESERPADETVLPSGYRPRVLWVDDNADMRQYVSRLLAGSYEVTALADGIVALDAACSDPPDLVVTDVMMPGLDGFGLLKGLRANPQTRTVPVILLSARAGEESRIEGLTAGADDYLVKPFSARELLARVHAHVQLAGLRRQAQSAHLAAERAEVVAANEAQLRLITDALPVLISYVDAQGRYQFANRAYEEWFGFDHDVLKGAELKDIWPKSVLAQSRDTARRVMAGEPVTFDVDVPDGSGQIRLLRCSYLPDVAPDGTVQGFVSYAQDETQRRRAAEQIQRLNDELEERVLQRTAQLAAANRDLESFSYTVSHDLRAPLRAIDGFASLLQVGYGDQLPEQAQRHLQLVRKNTQGMGQLIDGLLALARLGRSELRRTVIDHRALVQECVEDLLAAWPDRSIDVDLDDLPDCDADPTLLRQVWANLLANAVKYSAPRPTTLITIGWENQDDDVVFFCRDNGVGFDMRYAGKLFEVFQRLHRPEEFEGTGIGLATVQRIIARHGGSIWAHAQIDEGATFSFTLAGPVQLIQSEQPIQSDQSDQSAADRG
jgi:PAS domain S-box-containing protein